MPTSIIRGNTALDYA